MKLKSLTLILSLFLSSQAFAGNTNSQPQLDKVVDSINVDLDGDFYVDTAILAKPEKQAQDDLDLWIKLSTDNEYYKVEGLVFDMNGGMAGQSTKLKINAAGSLQVFSENDSIGRTRWEETTTFAYRNGTIVLAGYTHNWRDTLDMSFQQCDINLLSKYGVAKSQAGEVSFGVPADKILSLENVNQTSMIDAYLEGQCTGNLNMADFGENDI